MKPFFTFCFAAHAVYPLGAQYPFSKIIDIEEAPASFINPAGHYKIAVMNATHGAGATSVVVSLARYFELQNYKTAAVDLSGNYDLELAGLKNIEISADAADIDELNQEDYLFCYGQEYILDGKITSDGGTIKNFNFPFVPLRELFSD